MSQENEEVTQTVDDDAAFDAGLAMARGEESPPVADPVKEKVEETIEPEAKAEEPAPVVFAGLTEEQLKAFCRDRISHFKIPRYVRFVDEYPMTVTGKIQKFKMREIAIKELGLEEAANVKTA